MERILKSELEQEIADFKTEIDRLNNPEPPPLVPLSEPPKPPPNQEFFRPIPSTVSSLMNQSLLEDETTRTSDATDSRSMCDIKSESGPYGEWHDDWTEEENSSSVAYKSNLDTSTNRVKQEVKMNSSGFDIESEILPNFILNMKKSSAGGEHELDDEANYREKETSRQRVVDIKRGFSPVSSVKSECYDEWTSIQKELASMTGGGSGAATGGGDDKNKVEKSRFDDFDKVKRPIGDHLLNESRGAALNVEHSVTTTTTVKHQSSFFSLDSNPSESSLWDFQHNNSSFDFPMVGSGGATGTDCQMVNGQIGATGGVGNGAQKRSWNGLSENGGGGGGNGGGEVGGGKGARE